METLKMSGAERKRMSIVEKVVGRKLAIVRAAELMGVGYRQAKRIVGRYRQKGDAGLVHQSRGRKGGRAKPEAEKARALKLFAERYADFGPTLAAEKLVEAGLEVDHETLRRWLLEAGLWEASRRRAKHRQWRARKANFGTMVQLDGSHHDWMEGRREWCVLMVMVDDATNWTEARFFEEETTAASYEVLEVWIGAHGMPQSLYVDRDSIYRCERPATVAEEVADKEPQTQFGRAMGQLGVELILANSPQAKGRVERRHGLLQDRLVKEMRLAGISDLGGANRFLEEEFLPELNRRFVVAAANPVDVHGPRRRDLNEVLSWEEERVVQKDWTVAWGGRWFQIGKEAGGVRSRSRIVVRKLRDGQVRLLHKGRRLKWRELPGRPKPAKTEPVRLGRTQVPKPAAGHAWRRFGAAVGKPWEAGMKAEGEQRRAARRQG